jgi:hypothetical protein
MNIVKRTGFIGMIAMAAAACAAQPADEGNAPDVASDSVDEQDQGYVYNGWSQISWYEYNACGNYPHSASQWLSRSYGDASRGGGACYVKSTGASCSADTTCTTAAVAQYGAGAYGYCYSGTCYSRPGTQAAYCALNPNRANGHTVNVPNAFNDVWGGNNHLILCMTKTAGPNLSCGGQDTSQYMRSLNSLNYYYDGSC